MKFTLNFLSDSYGKKTIQEPFGMDAVSFTLKQKEDGMARDISFTSGEAMFEFTHMRNHELKQLLYYHRKFGYEAIVILGIEIDENNKFTCELDFAESETDDLEYFRCKGIQQGTFQVIKRRKETKVDVKSDVDLDGNNIGGLVPVNMLLLAKPVFQVSKWKQSTPTSASFIGYGQDAMLLPIADTIMTSNIENTLNPYSKTVSLPPLYSNAQYIEALNDCLFVEAENNLNSVMISIKGLTATVTEISGFFTKKTLSIVYNKTSDLSKYTTVRLEETSGQLNIINKDYFVPLDNIGRGSKISIIITIFQPYALPASTPVSSTSAFVNLSGGMTISTESVAYNSIAQSFRLIDVMKQVVKSNSGLSINAPRFDVGGEFYDNRLIDGNFLRGINNKNFSVSLEDLDKSFTEFKGDWEIDSDGKIFFGIEADFYTPIESGFFDNIQFSEMNKTFNPKYKVNEFRYKYNKYQSLKENEEPNSADTIHGESRLSFFNKLVENKKEVEVEWTRDAFLIEETRQKALIIKENTASQNDDTLFCIDSTPTLFDNTFTETSSFSHSFSSSSNRLSLTSDGTVNFLSLGIQVGSVFIIDPNDANVGTYTVFSVLNNVLELTGTSSGVAGDGIRPTKYTYAIDSDFTPFTNYTDQGFSETENLNASSNYSNRRYSIARNIYNYWKSYLATCNLYWKDKPIKNVWYKNNGDYTAKYGGVKLTEKADFIPDNPILSPILYNDIIFANVEFEDFILLQNNIRSQRGFIRTIDNNEEVIKIYPVEMNYKLLEKELTIKGEEKYESLSMTISTANAYILINNETRVMSLQWEIKSNKLYLYDENRYRIYNGVWWNLVSVNGALPNSVLELESWLNLIN
jgi:hypothetical protein